MEAYKITNDVDRPLTPKSGIFFACWRLEANTRKHFYYSSNYCESLANAPVVARA
jgi:hypothetical protein